MAGNKNPWRDVFSPVEWQAIVNQTSRANPRVGLNMGGHRGGGAGWTVATRGVTVTDPTTALTTLTQELSRYDAINKDNYTQFDQRITKLKLISVLCDKYRTMLGKTHTLGAKGGAGKQLNDQLDVWVASLGKRALKKAGYLDTMKQWHFTAKDKYKDRVKMSL